MGPGQILIPFPKPVGPRVLVLPPMGRTCWVSRGCRKSAWVVGGGESRAGQEDFSRLLHPGLQYLLSWSKWSPDCDALISQEHEPKWHSSQLQTCLLSHQVNCSGACRDMTGPSLSQILTPGNRRFWFSFFKFFLLMSYYSFYLSQAFYCTFIVASKPWKFELKMLKKECSPI